MNKVNWRRRDVLRALLRSIGSGALAGASLPGAAGFERIVEVSAADFPTVVLRASLERAIVVDFGAEWCVACRRQEPTTLAMVQEFSPRIRFARVDVDHSEAIAKRYQVSGIPTLLLFDNGRAISRMTGITSASRLRKWLSVYAGRPTNGG